MLRDEQQRNLDDLERWLKAVEREDFPESFPAQSNIVWETHLPMLYLLEEKEFNRAHSFVMERHALKKQAEKDANQPRKERANQLEKPVRDLFNRAHSFVMERHALKKQAEKDANQPRKERANQLEKPVRDLFNRAHSFVMERHTPRKQAEKDANQPLAVYGPQGRRLTDSPKRQKWRTQADFSR
jgi:hypothetical protein